MVTYKDLDIEIYDVILNVSYTFEKGEAEERYCSDGSGYPGSPNIIEIETICHESVDILQLLDDTIINTIKEKIQEHEN